VRVLGSDGSDRTAAGEVLTAKQAPHRPGTAPALGLRAFTPADLGVHTFAGLVLGTTSGQTITNTDTLDNSLGGSVLGAVLQGVLGP
jgi:hypothetical protein